MMFRSSALSALLAASFLVGDYKPYETFQSLFDGVIQRKRRAPLGDPGCVPSCHSRRHHLLHPWAFPWKSFDGSGLLPNASTTKNTWRLSSRVLKINALEADVEELGDDEPEAKTTEFRERLAKGEDLNGRSWKQFSFAGEGEAAWYALSESGINKVMSAS
jgi:hypothetical protein